MLYLSINCQDQGFPKLYALHVSELSEPTRPKTLWLTSQLTVRTNKDSDRGPTLHGLFVSYMSEPTRPKTVWLSCQLHVRTNKAQYCMAYLSVNCQNQQGPILYGLLVS